MLAEIVDKIVSKEITFDDGKLSMGTAVVSFGDVTSEIVNFYDAEDGLQKIGFASDNATINTSGDKGDLILVGKENSTLTSGIGNDSIFADEGGFVDAGEGNNFVDLSKGNNDGTTVAFTSKGKTTVKGFKTGFDDESDILFFGANDSLDFKIDGNDLTFKSDSGAQGVLTGIANNADSVKLLIADEVNRNEAVIIKKDATVAVDKDELARIYYGDNAGVDFSNVTKNLSIDLSSVVDMQSNTPLMFKGVNQITAGSGRSNVIGSDADETLIAGKGYTSLYGAGGNNVLRGNSNQTAPTEFFVFGGADGASTTIENFQFGTDKLNFLREEGNVIEVTGVDSSTGDISIKVTNTETNVYETAVIKGGANKNIQVSDLNGNTVIGQAAASTVTVNNEATFYQVTEKGGTLVVGSEVTGSKKLWLGDTAHSEGIELVGDIAVMNASDSSAQLELAGNDLANTILAGKGNSSLWGGNGGNDLLVGGSGQNSFYYGKGNGSDTINGVNDGDVVNLYDVSLDNIISTNFSNNAVALNFSDGGKLTVNENGKDLGFVVGDQTFYVNNEHNGFVTER